MIKIEKNNTYVLRLMPNFYDVKNNAVSYSIKNGFNKLSKYFTYVKQDNKIDIISFGRIIQKFISSTRVGFYGTSEGYFLSDDEITEYYANSDKSEISLYEDDDLKKYKDIIFYEYMNLYDLKCNYFLTFKTRDNQGYLEFYNIGILKSDDAIIYKDGDDKNKIIELYSNIEKLNVILQKSKDDLKSKNKDIIFID